MGFDANSAAISRTPVTLVRRYQDFCTRTFGVAPCTGTGEPCYNTYHTCKSRDAFDKTDRITEFSSADAEPPWPGCRPYVKSVTRLATEITDNITLTGRITVEMWDEPDTDVGIDPYVAQRSSVQGTFFRKDLARNPNYKGRLIEVYDGFLGDPFSEFRLRAAEPQEMVTVNRNVVKIQTVDVLKGLGEKETPPKTNLKLSVALAAGAAEIMLAPSDDFASLGSAGYIRIDDETIQYSAADATQFRLSGLSAVTVDHGEGTTVQLCRYFEPGNPFDHLKAIMLSDAGLDPALVDADAFDYWRDWPGGEPLMSAFITEPTKLSELVFGRKEGNTISGVTGPADSLGLADLLDCKVWVGEDGRVTIARNIPNAPGRTYRAVTDAENVATGSTSVDMHELARITISALYWDLAPLGKVDEAVSYRRRDIGVNADAVAEYGDSPAERMLCRWLHPEGVQEEVMAAYISDMLSRRLMLRHDAAPVVTVQVEMKDADILTGEYVTYTTDELLNPDGTPVTTRFQVVSRDPKDKIELKLQRMPVRRAAFYADESAADYASATPAQREYGGFYCDETTRKMPNGDDGFFYY